jgi:release factor glutamine methyltransferase
VESTRELVAAAAAQLAAAGVPTPEVDAELLLAHVTGRPRPLLRMAGSTVTEEQSDAYAALLAQRVRRIPLQHLTGLAPFRHLELHVGPGVFIPRPETELLVDHVLAYADARATPVEDAGGSGGGPREPRRAEGDPRKRAATGLRVVDLCAGSAALALSIASEMPGSRVIAVELSAEAVAWAGRNIADHAPLVAAVGSSLELLSADATCVAADGGPLAHLRGAVDVVVTNPPYVPEQAIPREPEVRDHDPGLALYGGPDGLQVVRPLVQQAAMLLRPGGLLLVEHADVQGEDAGESGVPAVLRSQRDPDHDRPGPAWADVTDHLDLAGRPRHTSALRADGRMAP